MKNTYRVQQEMDMSSLPDWTRKKFENVTPISQVLGENSFMADSPSLHLLRNGRNNDDQRLKKNISTVSVAIL